MSILLLLSHLEEAAKDPLGHSPYHHVVNHIRWNDQGLPADSDHSGGVGGGITQSIEGDPVCGSDLGSQGQRGTPLHRENEWPDRNRREGDGSRNYVVQSAE